jgi:hypothetical protein
MGSDSLVYLPARQRTFLVTPLNLPVASILLALGQSTVAATILYPPSDRLTRPVAVASIKTLIERRWEAFAWAYVVRAERCDTGFLRFGQRNFDIAVNPRQSLIAFDGVYLIAFGLRQLHALHYWLAIYHCGTTAYRPDAAAIFVSSKAIPLFLIQKLVENLWG